MRHAWYAQLKGLAKEAAASALKDEVRVLLYMYRSTRSNAPSSR